MKLKKQRCVAGVLAGFLVLGWGIAGAAESGISAVSPTVEAAADQTAKPAKKASSDKRSVSEKDSVRQLEDVVITEKKGTPEEGYRVSKADMGPLGKRDILDTPYSINVVPQDLLKRQQATTLKDVTKYLPSTQIEERGGPELGRPQTRGFQGSVTENNRMDGMNIAVTTAYPMEQFEQIEVLNGLAGSLYGPASPSGVFNFVLKRPTEKPLYELNMSYATQDQLTTHVDIGGFAGEKLGYRLNALYGEGEGVVDSSSLERKLASIALDWHLSDTTVLETNFSDYIYEKEGYSGSFAANTDAISLPDAVDPTTTGLGQTWAGSHLDTRTASAKLKHDLNADWNFSAGFLDQVALREQYGVTNTLLNNSGSYRTTFRPQAMAFETDSGMLYLNGRFFTGDLGHELTLGANGQERRTVASRTNMASTTLGVSSLYNPASYAEPSWWLGKDWYKSGLLRQQNMVLGDTILFNEAWSSMVSASQSWIDSRSYNTSGKQTSSYDDGGASYMASLMYKPIKKMTTYVMYADSLQAGDTAPSAAVNANEILAPYRSEQWEGGVKVALSGINLTGAVFRIERPFAYTDTANVFRVQGNQVNTGLELMASGEVIHRVTVFGGVTFLDPKLEDTKEAATSGQQVVGVPEEQANLLVEYRMPYIEALTPYVNLHYTGKRPANDVNTSWADAYTTIDIGARYVTKVMGVGTTWRLTVNNLTDEEYWSSIFPGSINGDGSSYSAFLGSPREILASMQLNF